MQPMPPQVAPPMAPQAAPPMQPGAGAPVSVPTGVAGSSDPRVAQLEAQCAQLRRDVDSIALFARTLLSVLEAKGVCTEQEFQEAKLKLDAADGKVDDR